MNEPGRSELPPRAILRRLLIILLPCWSAIGATDQLSVTPVARDRLAAEMLQLARVVPGDVVYDLGSIGTIPIVAAQRFGARGVAVGLDASQADTARAAARTHGVADRTTFVEGNLLTATFAEATVVTLDLTPELNLILEPVLRKQLRPGTRIVSHRFGIGAWRADDTARTSDGTPLYFWTVPAPPSRAPDIFFVPTEQRVVEQMLDLAGVTRSDTIYDLGSGDGRIPVIAAQKYGARGVGIEIEPSLVSRARQVAREAQVDDKVRFLEADLYEADLSEATVVTLFLSPSINRRLAPKLKRDLRSGARVVSHQFDMGDWPPDRSIPAEDGTTLFLWIIKR